MPLAAVAVDVPLPHAQVAALAPLPHARIAALSPLPRALAVALFVVVLHFRDLDVDVALDVDHLRTLL